MEKQVEIQLFRLYHNESEIAQVEKETQKKQTELEKIEKKKEKAEEVLKEKKKEQGKVSREMAKLEQDIREMVSICFMKGTLYFFNTIRKTKLLCNQF